MKIKKIIYFIFIFYTLLTCHLFNIKLFYLINLDLSFFQYFSSPFVWELELELILKAPHVTTNGPLFSFSTCSYSIEIEGWVPVDTSNYYFVKRFLVETSRLVATILVGLNMSISEAFQKWEIILYNKIK